MSQQNRAIILTAIQERGPISRADLAVLLGLNPATLTRITRDLIADGLITVDGEGETKGAGRKPILLRFNHGARLVIAVRGDHRQLSGALGDLASETLHRAAALDLSVERLVADLLEGDPSYRQRLAAICVCVPAAVGGVETLRARYDVPVLETDSVTAAAVSEAAATGADAFALLYLGARSANCLYLHGQTRVGQLGLSAEGRALTEILSDAGLIAAFRAARATGAPTALSHGERAALIFEAARHGDPAALAAVTRVTRDLAYCVAWHRRAFDISRVVIAGEWIRAADVLLPALRGELSAWGDPLPEVVRMKDEAPLMGALRMAIRVADPTR